MGNNKKVVSDASPTKTQKALLLFAAAAFFACGGALYAFRMTVNKSIALKDQARKKFDR